MQMEVWRICESITEKSDWYEKIFNDDIVKKWEKEIGGTYNFNLAVRLLQATAKGSKHLKDCPWDELPCELCKEECSDEDEDDFYNCNEHIRCNCVEPDFTLKDYVEYLPKGFIGKELHSKCKILIDNLRENCKLDYHPGTNDKVRNMIHPSMYCYVKGKSVDVNKEFQEAGEEQTNYQWLPSEFYIDFKNQVSIESYINNLDESKNPTLIEMLEEIFSKFLPSLEKVMARNLNGTNLQVIVKISETILSGDDISPTGSWHIEGMPYEHIAATCIYYINVDNIKSSFLEFRKPTIINEINISYPQNDELFTKHHFGISDHTDGEMNRYLGLIKCEEGYGVVFPNNIQHRVKEFTSERKTEDSRRTILAFFVVDPDKRIISTKDIPKQQTLFSLEEAHFHRERLMFHRKFFVDKLNKKVFERPYSLCEH